jgi:hypothetical protein
MAHESSPNAPARPGTLAILETLYRGFWRIQLEGQRRFWPFHTVALAYVLGLSIQGGITGFTWLVLGAMALFTTLFMVNEAVLRRLNAPSTRAKDVPLAAPLGFAIGRWCRKLSRK